MFGAEVLIDLFRIGDFPRIGAFVALDRGLFHYLDDSDLAHTYVLGTILDFAVAARFARRAFGCKQIAELCFQAEEWTRKADIRYRNFFFGYFVYCLLFRRFFQ